MSRVHVGVHAAMEAEADAWIYGSLRGVTKQSAKADILTPWKQQDRLAREVYSKSGTVDPSIRRGMYHRAPNRTKPHLNSRDGVAAPARDSGSPITYLTRSDAASGEE